MDFLERLKIINSITDYFNENKTLYKSFYKIFLFGSILNPLKNPNDLDILFIYEFNKLSHFQNLSVLIDDFRLLFNLTVHLTVLSVNEQNELNFINKLNGDYFQVK